MPSQSTPRRPRKHDWGGELSLTDAFTDAFLCSPVRRVLVHNIAGISPTPPDRTLKHHTGPKKPDLSAAQPHLPTGGSAIPDKILLWRGTGAGVVAGLPLPVPALVPAGGWEEAGPATATKQHPSVPVKSKQDDIVQAEEQEDDKKASGPGEVAANNTFSPRRIYSPATPKKRVVSDGHWMKDKPKATSHTSDAVDQVKPKRKEKAIPNPPQSDGLGQARPKGKEKAVSTPPPDAPKQAGQRAKDGSVATSRPSDAPEQARPKGKERAVETPSPSNGPGQAERIVKEKAVSTPQPSDAPEQAMPRAAGKAVSNPRPSKAPEQARPKAKEKTASTPRPSEAPDQARRKAEETAVQTAPTPEAPKQTKTRARETAMSSPRPQEAPEQARPKGKEKVVAAPPSPEVSEPAKRRAKGKAISTARPSGAPGQAEPKSGYEAGLAPQDDENQVRESSPTRPALARGNRTRRRRDNDGYGVGVDNTAEKPHPDTRTPPPEQEGGRLPRRAGASRIDEWLAAQRTPSPSPPADSRRGENAKAPPGERNAGPSLPRRNVRPARFDRRLQNPEPRPGRLPADCQADQAEIAPETHIPQNQRSSDAVRRREQNDERTLPPPSSHLPANWIEVWLNNTADPFVDDIVDPAEPNPLSAVRGPAEKPRSEGGPASALPVAPGEDEVTFQAATIPEEDACKSQSKDGENGLERRLTTDTELMSVLSLPDTVGVKQRRKRRVRKDTVTIPGLESIMAEFAADEHMYSRVLHTLVEGVIPVLLSCVLSGSDTASAAWLYGDSAQNQNNSDFTRPIIDIGVCLERLKDLHTRVPLQDPTKFLQWAQVAHSAYEEYISCWRLAFEDVIINLAPVESEEEQEQMGPKRSKERRPDDVGMPQDENGDIIDENGEKVDVAYLLSVPLHRTRGLKTTIEAIDAKNPSELAAKEKGKWGRLWKDGENKVQKEESRRQGEKVAATDTSRVRDLPTLAPTGPPDIDMTRSVVLHGIFSMQFCHSSKAVLHSQVKLYLREDAPESGKGGGDLLICALEGNESYLLFPPIEKSTCSAKASVEHGELIIQVHGAHASGSEWKEHFLFITDCRQQCHEWPVRLGTDDKLPNLVRHDPFLDGPSRALVLARHTPPAPAPSTMGLVPRRASPGHSHMTARPKPKGPRLLEYNAGQDSAGPVAAEAPPPSPRQDRGGSGSGLRRANAKRHPRSLAAIDPSGSRGEDAEKAQSAAASDGSVLTVSEAGPVPSEQGSSLDAVLAWGTDEEEAGSVLTASAGTSAPSERASSPDVVPAQGDGGEAQGSDAAGRGGSEVAGVAERAPSSSGRLPGPAADTSRPQKGRLFLPAAAQLRAWQPSTVGATGTRRRGSSPLKHEYAPSSASEGDSETESEGSSESVLGPGDGSPLADAGPAGLAQEEVALEVGDAPPPPALAGPLCRPGERPSPGSAGSVANATLTPSESASQAPYRGVPHSREMAPFRVMAQVKVWRGGVGASPSWANVREHACVVAVSAGLVETFDPVAAGPQQTAAAAAEAAKAAATTTEAAETAGQQQGSPPAAADAKEETDITPLVRQILTPLSRVEPGTALDVFVRSPLAASAEPSELSGHGDITYRCRSVREASMLRQALMVAQARNPTYDALRRARSIHDPNFLAPLKKRHRAPPRSFASRAWQRIRGGSSSARRTAPLPLTAAPAASSSSIHRANSISATSAAAASPPSALVSESSVGTRRSMLSAMRLFEHGGRAFNIARSSVGRRSSAVPEYHDDDGYDYDDDDDYYNYDGRPLAAIAEEDGEQQQQGAAVDDTEEEEEMRDVKCRLWERTRGSGIFEVKRSARLTIRRPDARHRAPPDHMHITVMPKEAAAASGAAPGAGALLNACLGPESFGLLGRKSISVQLFEERGPDQQLVHADAVGGVGMSQRLYIIEMKNEAQTMRALRLLKL